MSTIVEFVSVEESGCLPKAGQQGDSRVNLQKTFRTARDLESAKTTNIQ